jgi:hypothetical protein
MMNGAGGVGAVVPCKQYVTVVSAGKKAVTGPEQVCSPAQ